MSINFTCKVIEVGKGDGTEVKYESPTKTQSHVNAGSIRQNFLGLEKWVITGVFLNKNFKFI